MNYPNRYHELAAQFKMGGNIAFENSDVVVRFFAFHSHVSTSFSDSSLNQTMVNDSVGENERFKYPVFIHSKRQTHNEVILFLHGLNERSWNKYLPWAEYLCRITGKAVLLFPIAYHVNRSPANWTNPRLLQKILDLRRKQNGQDRSLSFANVALSERLSDNPYRFYNSGRQSYFDVVKLISSIKSGKHPMFVENTKVDVFAYSIGAFLSQILFLTNPNKLLSNARLFMFCGGAIFNSMYGESRSIMDRKSFERLLEYYQSGCWTEKIAMQSDDDVMKAFYSMIAPENAKEHRVQVFEQMQSRLRGVSLMNDKVMPYAGVVAALGADCAAQCISVADFPYDYSHENPFPVNITDPSNEITRSFLNVFDKAADFLSH